MELLNSRAAIVETFDRLGYVVDNELSTIVYLMQKLNKPLLLEGNPGVGKTAIASVLSRALDTELIRLQCYEGLDVSSAVYEWNYQKQLLSIRIQEGDHKSEEEKESHIFGEDFLLKRPLLKAITAESSSPVLLIDEIDRADEEFEAFLLELLSEQQISIPEMGTVKATHAPLVILTSNRTRELSDALKRRCLYHWVEYPDLEKEMRIVRKHRPDIDTDLVNRVIQVVHKVRKMKLAKTPGIAETIDWVNGLLALGYEDLTDEAFNTTLGCLLKNTDDISTVRQRSVEELLEAM